MNKSDLIDALAEQLGTSKKAAGESVEAFLALIVKSVASGESVSISGFGVFEKQERAARVGRNPRTGETVRIKATAVPKFRSGTDFKTAVAGRKRAAKKIAAKAPAKKAPAKKAAPAKKTAAKAPAKKATRSR